MANRSDRRFQTLIYPEAATASRKADEEKARGFPCRLDAQKSHHNEAEYTDAVQTRSHALPVLAQQAGVHIRIYVGSRTSSPEGGVLASGVGSIYGHIPHSEASASIEARRYFISP